MNPGEELKWLSDSEELAFRTFAHDGAAELAALDRACGLLLQALRGAPAKTGRDEINIDAGALDSDQPAELALKAHLLLGARTLQVARAYRALLAFGYEHEGNALIRTMLELIAHRCAFEDDETGKEAYRWIRGQRSVKERDLDRTVAPVYRSLHPDAHGDSTALARLADPQRSGMSVGPDRTVGTRAGALLVASAVRRQAAAVAYAVQMELPEAADLERSISELRKCHEEASKSQAL
jgi:hypothetical protein